MKRILLFLVLTFGAFAEGEGRYQIFSAQKESGEKTIFLLDTKTGQCFQYQEFDSELGNSSGWEPVDFHDQGMIDEKNKYPRGSTPEELNKKMERWLNGLSLVPVPEKVEPKS